MTRATASRAVIKESGKCRSGRERLRVAASWPSIRGGKTPHAFSDDEREAAEYDGNVVVPAWEAPSLVVVEHKDAIDSFIDRYGAAGLSDVARAFNAIGAKLIAAGLRRLAVAVPPLPESLLDSVNRLITDRCGYDYDAIIRAIDQLRQD